MHYRHEIKHEITQEYSSTLVDASDINISDMGSMGNMPDKFVYWLINIIMLIYAQSIFSSYVFCTT